MKKTCGCLNHQPRQFLQLSVATVTSWSCWNLKYSISQQRWAYKAEWADRRNRTFACCHTACLLPDQEASIGLILDTMVMSYFMVLTITMPEIMLATLQMRCQGNWRGEISGWAAPVLRSLHGTCACQRSHRWLFCFCMQCTDLWLGIPRGVARARGMHTFGNPTAGTFKMFPVMYLFQWDWIKKLLKKFPSSMLVLAVQDEFQ